MGKYRTLSKKETHFGGPLDPKKSARHRNVQRVSEQSSGNLLPVLTKECQWAKRKKSSCNLGDVQNLSLILFIGASFLLFQHCASSPIDAGSASTAGILTDAILSDNNSTGKINSVHTDDIVEESDPLLSPTPRNCTSPSSEEFPTDLFTKEQRQHGAIAVHFLALFYMLYALLLVCDAYFIPAIECICQELHISPNVAGATFMAISTSAPELFTNVIGTFVTKGDLGVGTIVGSAVFNVLAVGSCIGIGTNFAVKSMTAGSRNKRKGVPLDWWSLSRDTTYYLLSVGILIAILFDGRVYWYEAVVMLAYMAYTSQECSMIQVTSVFAHDVTPIRKLSTLLQQKLMETKDEASPLICEESKERSYGSGHGTIEAKQSHNKLSLGEVISVPNELFDSNSLSSNTTDTSDSSVISTVATLEALKDILVFDIRVEKMRKWCGLSLACCVGWIEGLSYVISWMICIIGETFQSLVLIFIFFTLN